MKKMTALLILDGYGIGEPTSTNAIYTANTPILDRLMKDYPTVQLGASGMDVGLPDGQMGNSEVGHTNIGAGRVVYQELTRVTKSIMDGDFFTNQAFLSAIDHVKKTGGRLHLMGLLSDGGVHSHNTHLYALLRLAKQQGLPDAFVHCFMDGRDVPPTSGKGFVEQLQEEMKKENFGQIATVMGRYWAMDRDTMWDRIQRAYDAMVLGEGERAICGASAMQASYDKGETDEFVTPTVVVKNGAPVATIAEGDSVIFFNFRPDRAREITRSFIEKDFTDFERKTGYQSVFFVSLTQYDVTFQNITHAYDPQSLDKTLGQYLSEQGKTQLRIAETTKYAHVTFFFNGGVEEPNAGEDRVLIDTPKVATFDLKPSMSAFEVADKAVALIHEGKYDAMILNFANCDMVGHTGILSAAQQAVEAVDTCVGMVVDAILKHGGSVLITADHGNADKMLDTQTGEPFTAHTTNPVPLIFVSNDQTDVKLQTNGRLCDIAPTLLDIMGLTPPSEMTGKSLLS